MENTRVPAASVLLDVMRSTAAFLVLISHWRNLLFLDFKDLDHAGVVLKSFYFLTGLGHQAVMIFFVLSGYLVAGSVERTMQRGKWSLSYYLNQRIVRLELVLIPALLLGYTCDWTGSHWGRLHGLYDGTFHTAVLSGVPTANMSLGNWIGNVLFLQGILASPFGTNTPLWSLSYEFWYYLFFPAMLIVFITRRRRTRIAGLAFLAASMFFVGKTIVFSYSIWLMGAAITQLPRLTWLHTAKAKLALFCMTLAPLGLILAAMRSHFGESFATDALVSVACTAMVYAATQCDFTFPARWVEQSAAWFAGWSYTQYLVHMPFLVMVTSFLLHGRRWAPKPPYLLVAGGVLGITSAYSFLVAQCTERHTDAVRRWTYARIVQPCLRWFTPQGA